MLQRVSTRPRAAAPSRQLRSHVPLVRWRLEGLARDLVAGVAFELPKRLSALRRVAVLPPKLPARRRAVMAARRLASLRAPGRLAGLLGHARHGAGHKARNGRENHASALDSHRS